MTIVDTSSPLAIHAAIRSVNSDPQRRSRYGLDVLWRLYKAPDHSLLRSAIDTRDGVLNLHFGWFCKRVAEELGDKNPDALALVDYSDDANGRQVLTLKPSVVAALSARRPT